MNRRQRVEAVLEGKSPDRIPVCFWHHFSVRGREETVRAHTDWLRDSGVDLLKMMSDEFFFYPLGGAVSPADFLALRPLGKNSPYVRGQIERAGQIREAAGEVVTLYNVFSPYANLKHAMGQDRALALLDASPEAFAHILGVILTDTLDVIEGLLTESGVDGAMLCLQGAEETLFDDETYLKYLRPGEQGIVQAAARLSSRNLLHLCGWDGIPDRLERWKDYPSAMVNWDVDVERVKLRDGKKYFGDRVLLGGLNNRPGSVLHRGTREEVRSATLNAVREAEGSRFILGADCSLPEDIDPERIRWVIEALEA